MTAPEHDALHTSRPHDRGEIITTGPRRPCSPFEPGLPIVNLGPRSRQTAIMSSTPIWTSSAPSTSLESSSSVIQASSSASKNSAVPSVGRDKGKSVLRSRPIKATTRSDDDDDLFGMSPVNSSFDEHMNKQSSSHLLTSTALEDLDLFETPSSSRLDHHAGSRSIDKAKAREEGLPMVQTPMEVKYGRVDWPSPGSPVFAGPSSYGSILASIVDNQHHSTYHHPSVAFPTQTDSPGPSTPSSRRPSRVRSMSDASIRSTRIIASRIKVKLSPSKIPSMLTKKLLSKKRDVGGEDVIDGLPPSPPANPLLNTELVTASSSQTRLVFDLTSGLPASPAAIQIRPSRDAYLLRSRGRANTSPYPLTSAMLDVVPPSTADLLLPIEVKPSSLFEALLPHELKIQVLHALVGVIQAEHDTVVAGGTWTALKAASSRFRWVGTDKAVRMLIKLGRVSKSWTSITRDGQLWQRMDLRAFPKLPVETLLGLARSSGSSTRYINLSGHGTLKSSTLQELVSSLYIAPSQLGGLPFTQLTEVNLRGCCNVSTRTLHHLLMCSPALVSLGLRGLTAVANSTCDIIGVYCTRLESLDISRCINLDGSGVRSMCEAVFTRREPLHLRELRAAGLKYVTSDLMLIMGHVAPHLEVLDLSGARSLTNSGLRAFIECMEDDDVEKVVLTSRQAGLDPTDPTRHWRRVTRLRHLAVSCCTSLTDVAFKHLAHAVPQLVYLEAAGIGAGIHDDGLVHLLRTTPLLKKLDLEDASSITDGVISALTPDSEANDAQRSPRTGQFLEHLTLSYATQVSDEALSRLIQACSCLRILEADNTRMSGTVLQEFVRTTRRRGIHDAMIAAGDNRNVGESTVTGLQSQTRPRQGFREWDARRLGFLDYRDQEGLENIGSDECDPSRVVVKTFYSWQMVDTVRATRRKHAKSRRVPSWEEDMRIDRMEGSSRMRWWSPGGRRIVSALTTPVGDPREAGDACIIM